MKVKDRNGIVWDEIKTENVNDIIDELTNINKSLNLKQKRINQFGNRIDIDFGRVISVDEKIYLKYLWKCLGRDLHYIKKKIITTLTTLDEIVDDTLLDFIRDEKTITNHNKKRRIVK